MAQTVIGIFDNMDAAQNAVERLTSQGFTMDDIDISGQGSTGVSGTDTYSSTDRSSSMSDANDDHSGDGLGDRISRFFRNLFDDDDDTEKYSSVAKKGTIV